MGHGLGPGAQDARRDGLKDQRFALRGAVYRGDGPAVVHLLHHDDAYDNVLQLGGDGLVAALVQRVDGASDSDWDPCKNASWVYRQPVRSEPDLHRTFSPIVGSSAYSIAG